MKETKCITNIWTNFINGDGEKAAKLSNFQNE